MTRLAWTGSPPAAKCRSTVGGDFVVDGPAKRGVEGLVNLFGIESPGLTTNPAINAMLSHLID